MYISKGDEPNSTRTFDTLVEKFADDERLAWAVVQVAERYWDFGSMEPACQMYEQALNINPGYEQACWVKMRLIMALIKRSDLETAETKLTELLTEFAGSDQLAPAVHEIVEQYRDSGYSEESRGLFAYILDNWSQDDGTNLELQVGVILQNIRLRELSKADAAINKLIADHNDNTNIAKALFQIGEEYYYVNEYRSSIKLLELIDANYPDHDFPAKSEVPFVLATCNRKLEDYDKAIEYYHQTLVKYPTNRYAVRCPYWMGILYQDMKNEPNQAVYWFEQQRELYPNSELAQNALYTAGHVYLLDLKDYVSAAEAFEQYITDYPDGSDIWPSYTLLARTYTKLGDRTSALEVLQKAYERSGNDTLRGEFMNRIISLEVEGGTQ